MSISIRKRIENASAPLLLRLHAMPRFVVPVMLVAALLVGFITTGVISVVAILFVALFVTWLLYLSWPLLDSGPRVLRAAVVALLLAVLLGRMSG